MAWAVGARCSPPRQSAISPHLPHSEITMRPTGFVSAIATSAIVLSFVACTSDPSGPQARSIRSGGASADVVAATEQQVPDASFTAGDENENGTICVKDTPSGHFLIRDDNLNTPSQPCPPSYAVIGKGKAVKNSGDWTAEDDNGNGAVCVKEVAPGRFVVKDDNLQTPSQPCPPSFLPTTVGKGGGDIPAGPASEADDNGNGVVCLHIVDGTGDAIVRDDNLATPSQPCPPAYSAVGLGKK